MGNSKDVRGVKVMKFLSLILILLSTPVYAGPFRSRSCHTNCYVQPVYYAPVVQKLVIEEKYSIPIRTTTFSEVKGLKILQDETGHEFYEINGKLVARPGSVVEETKEILNKDRIIIEKSIIKTY
jgi:hypothetical protein